MSMHGISLNSFCNCYSDRYCVSLRFIVIWAVTPKLLTSIWSCIAVHGLSDNSVRSVYLGYIYPMYYLASLLPMLLTPVPCKSKVF